MDAKKGIFDKYMIISIVSLGAFLILFFYDIFKWVTGNDNGSYQLSDGRIIFYILWACLSLILLLEQKNHKIMYVWLFAITIFAVVFIFLDVSYSPIDEASHLDIIHYISVNHRYPTMYENMDGEYLGRVIGYPVASYTRYEGVQMPLYYVIMGLITAAFPENISIVYFLRCIGLLCLLLVVYIAKKALILLENNGYISDSQYTNLVLLLVSGNPGIIIRFTRVSNESLAVLLATCVLYLAVRLLIEGYNGKVVFWGSVLSIALYYTKTTGMFVIGGIWFFLVYYKKWKQLVISLMTYVIAAIPWMMRCSKLYGTFTGLNKHMEFVIPIVNPDRIGYNLVVGAFKIFTSAFFLPAESGTQSQLMSYLHEFIGVLFILIFVSYFVSELPNIFAYIKNKFNFIYTKEEKKNILCIWAVVLILVDLVMLAYSTYTTKIDTMMGRYIYFLIIPLCVLVIKFLHDINFNRQIAVVMILFYSICFINVSISYVNSVGEQKGVWVSSEEAYEEDNVFESLEENIYV